MATICRICKVGRGRPHKMSCNYSKYRQQVQWVDSVSGTTVGYDHDYGNEGSWSCDTTSTDSSFDSGGCGE